MEAQILKICGIAVLCAVVGIVLSGLGKGGIYDALRLCGLALCLGGVLVLLGEAVAGVRELSGGEEYVSVMLRGLGICVLCRICADICRDSGQAGLSGAVEMAGKLALILLALPLVGDILELAADIMGKW